MDNRALRQEPVSPPKSRSSVRLGSGFLLFGFLFLINPDFFTLDLLPDLFGYLLIAHGLYRLSFLEDRIDRARRLAKILALLSLLKLLSNLFALTAHAESDRLTVMFLFACAEGSVGFVMVSHLFKGVQYLAVRQNSDLSLKGIDVASIFTKAFIIAKNVLAFLPASLILFFPEVDSDPDVVEGYGALRHNYMSTRILLTAICFIGVLSFGIYTTAVIAAYRKRVCSDKAFVERLRELYREQVLANENAMVRIHVRESFGYFLAALIFLPDFYIDHTNLLPGFVAGVLVCLGLSNLAQAKRVSPVLIRSARVASVLSLASYFVRFMAMILLEDKFQMWFWGSPLAWVSGVTGGVSAVVFLCGICLSVNMVCRKETEAPFRVFTVFFVLLSLGAVGCGVYNYVYPGRNGVVQAVAIALALIALYLFWRKSDQIVAEVEYRRM